MYGQSETWKICSEFPNYEVSNHGNLRHIHGEMRKFRYIKGYAYVCIRANGKYRNLRVHRLIAKEFIPNPENKPCVNHKNGKKEDNRIENLEWCTPSENELHKCRILGKKSIPPKIMKSIICVETQTCYPSVKSADESFDINYRHIGEVANGKRKTAGGLHWVWSAK